MEIVIMMVKKNERGASLVEYALLVALVAIACIGALQSMGTQVSDSYTKIAATIKNPSIAASDTGGEAEPVTP